MKKILLILLLVLGVSCVNVSAQLKTSDAPPRIPTHPFLYPNVGYSFEMGRIGKVGLIAKVYKKAFIEFAYAQYNLPTSTRNAYPGSYLNESRKKFLYGVGVFLNKKQNLFLNASYVHRINNFENYQSYHKKFIYTKTIIDGISLNAGQVLYFNETKNKGLSIICKAGLSFSTYLFYTLHRERIVAFPNVELSFCYAL